MILNQLKVKLLSCLFLPFMSLAANIIKAAERKIACCSESVKLDNQENNAVFFLIPSTDSTHTVLFLSMSFLTADINIEQS